MKNHWALLLIIVLFSSCDFLFPPKIEKPHPIPPVIPNQLTDARDGQVYKTVDLIGKTWMAENLNFKMADSWCYGDQPANGNAFGRLYNWHAAQVACPDGWRIPNNTEWKALLSSFGGYTIPQGDYTEGDPKLAYQKAVSTFNLSLSGARLPGYSNFPAQYIHMGENAFFWTSEEMDAEKAHNVTISGKLGNEDVLFDGTILFRKTGGYACRCIKN